MVLNKKYSKIYALLLLLLMAAGNAMAQGGVVVGGNVYGGGNLAPVKENTEVKMSTGTVNGNVFGGGKGKADNFTCDKAMVGIDKDNNGVPIDDGVTLISGTGENAVYELKPGGTTVIITNGTVEGDVFGGGEVGRVERNTIVTIGKAGDTSLTPVVKGNVFGAGKGVETHGYSALVRGNSTVTIQGQAHVWKTVHGGGEKASVGRYYVAKDQTDAETYHVRIGMPCYLKAGGKCTVNIQDNATIGEEGEANTGDVYGAGQGVTPIYNNEEGDEDRSKRMVSYVAATHTIQKRDTEWNYYVDEDGEEIQEFVWEYFPTKDAYLLYVETLGRASKTDVVIGGKRESAGTITASSEKPTVWGTVYGGSESGFVYYSTEVNMLTGTVEGDVFGGGKGLSTYAEAGRVRRNTKLTITDGTVKGNVYGGGSLGDVGTIDKTDQTNYNYTWKQTDGNTANVAGNNAPSTSSHDTSKNTGICTVIINGGTIGVDNPADATKRGNVFGASRGLDDTWWCEKAMVFATNVSVTAGTVKGSVYGGGEIGRVEDDVKMTIGAPSGTDNLQITGNVFGAGKGLATHGYSALVRGNSDVTVQGKAKVAHSVYGGGEIATVGRYVVVGGVPTEPNGGGNCTVTVKDDAVITEDVFGAGQGVDPATYRSTGEDRSKRMMVYNPEDYTGESGTSTWAFITTYDPSYEGTKFVWEYFTEAQYRTFLETLALASDTEVTVGGTTTGKTAKIKGSVYGGSESGFLQRHAQVKILNNCEIGTTNGTNDVDGYVFGGGKGLPDYAAGGRVSGYTKVVVSGGTMHGSVYGGGENGYVKGGVNVDMTDGIVNHDVYGGGALADTNTGNGSDYISVPGITTGASVTGLYEKIYESATGTAQAGVTYYEDKNGKYVVKSVKVGDSVTGLYVVNFTTTSDETAQSAKTYYTNIHPTTVNLLGGTIKGDAYGGGLGRLAATGVEPIEAKVDGDVKINLNGMAPDEYNDAFEDCLTPVYVSSNEGESGSNGGEGSNEGEGNSGNSSNTIIKYRASSKGCIVKRIFGCNNLNGSPKGNVTVHVYATQHVDKNSINDKYSKALEQGTNETLNAYLLRLINATEKDQDTYMTGVNTTVITAAQEVQANAEATEEQLNAAIDNVKKELMNRYDVRAVYGGGNEAAYIPTTPYKPTDAPNGSKNHVIIEGCDYTSIETVYGGGNAAPAPETNVDVYSSYEIETVFGGGNGKDRKESDNSINPGANVGMYNNGTTNVKYGTGSATTMIYGGTVHGAYGGSNEKGTIYGDVVIDVGANDPNDPCELKVGKLVGAGKNADVNGDLKIIMGCKPSEKIPLVIGGADNANVNGDVELTVTSGNFGNIVGGNNDGGCIRGHLILNVEETTCIPLNIDHLYLCGYNAAYSQYGYYVLTTKTEGTPYGDPTETAVTSEDTGKLQLIPRESAADPHKPVKTYSYNEAGVGSWEVYNGRYDDTNKIWEWEVSSGVYNDALYASPVLNVISCTSIGEVFGGGYGATATVYGNPTVNINMIPGNHAATALGGANKLGAIDDVYGGGDAAAVYGNTTVNIGTETSTSVYRFAQDPVSGEYHVQYDEHGAPIQDTRTVTGAYITGNVYGGGKLADVGKTHLDKDENDKDIDVVDIEGSTFVNIAAVKGEEILDEDDNPTGRYNYTSVSLTADNPFGIKIGGNVYGGGKGKELESGDGAFRCAKAMVTKHTNVAIGNGTIGDGDADHGHVYGGGEKGRVQENTTVTIGCEDDANSAPIIMGNVFGAGKGISTHGYSALARGNSYVTVQGEAKVKKSVYGGGEIASVGKYNVAQTPEEAQEHGVDVGMPYSLANEGSGYCTVIVRDNAVIGPDAAMVMTATGYPDDKGHVFGAGKGVLPYEGYEDDDIAWRVGPTNEKQEYLSKNQAIAGTINESDYLTYVETLGLATQTYVTIEENAFVKGSVYGGSENGYVQHDTQVNIRGNCQIGNGYVQMDDDGHYLDTKVGVNRRYTEAEWAAGHLFVDNDPEIALTTPEDPEEDPEIADATESALRTAVGDNYTSSLPECASWPYGQASGDDKYAPWDMYADTSGYDSKGGRKTADDGHTFYGNVFGGGSGLIPYRPGKWHPEAGSVAGNTVVNITGGHILTSVYGGNELTDVYGKCTINFGGTATLGVPRTLKQIAAHPVTCYLFGAGKGDQRVLFNKKTNVEDVEVNITGGTIYGSVFGGGEDGHVLRDIKMTIGQQTTTGEGNEAVTTISGPTIGTWGTSYVDGNVFGGGRGFAGDAYTAGNVAGSIKMEIKGGNILGSIYGGGRLGSVGYGLFESSNTANYGVMQDDNKDDEGETTTYYKEGDVGLGRGHIDITISGGTIGNDREYKLPDTTPSTGNAPSGLENTDYKTWTSEQWTAWKEHNNIPKTEFDTTNGWLTHTKGGNVFAGGMGNFYKQDGETYISDVNWWQLGSAKSTKLTITGGIIKSNVYGGGELGQVVGHHTIQNAANENVDLSTEITIQGSTVIGTEVQETVIEDQDDGEGGTTQVSTPVTSYTFGSVFGGGYGSLVDEMTVNGVTSYPKFTAGLVKEDTKVDMQGGEVKASVYGGGEMACVGESTTSGNTTTATGSTYVTVSGGTVGIAPITVGDAKRYFGAGKMGNVYGGGSGSADIVRSGKIFKNTNVTISQAEGKTTRIYHNVYGGGAYGTVGDFAYSEHDETVTVDGESITVKKVNGVSGLAASGTGVATVTITGGTIGYDGKENGIVFGSSRGDINQPGARDDHGAWVYDTHVTIGTSGSDSGPQINGTVYGSGENGHVYNNTEVNIYSGTIGIESGADYPYRGNVYGGGCGTDMYYSDPTKETHDGGGDMYNSMAGIVYGNATINITGGHVVRNVYGAGAMGSVGKIITAEGVTTINSGGLTTINISGGQVGVDGNNGDGNVFGAARGNATTTQTDVALVKNTGVNISGSADVKGNVYGGGEAGDVQGNTNVDIQGGIIAMNVFGGGKGDASTFECAKAMVGKNNDGACKDPDLEANKDKGTRVTISNGTVGTLETINEEKVLVEGTGNVYGGGEIGRVEWNTQVTIGLKQVADVDGIYYQKQGETDTYNEVNVTAGSSIVGYYTRSGEEGSYVYTLIEQSAPIIEGEVFGAGKGLETHGYSALVRGNSTVTVQGNAKVGYNVYGGGEKSTVGRYWIKGIPATECDGESKPTAPDNLPDGMPYQQRSGGICRVTIQGEAEIGYNGAADDKGRVFGAGKGVDPHYYVDVESYPDTASMPKRMATYAQTSYNDSNKDYWKYTDATKKFVWEYFPSKAKYFEFLQTLALVTNTYVTIDESAKVKGNIYGGSESGFVQTNTNITMLNGVIGTDGSSYGNIFGGGLGFRGFDEAGIVKGNTMLDIFGGTIYGSVFGGGAMSKVVGSTNVNIGKPAE